MADTESRIAFGDGTMLDPWSTLVTNLIQDFDANEQMFTEVRNLSKYQLGPMASCIKDGRQYFDILENNLCQDDLLEFLINLMDYTNFHQDLYFGGRRIADTLKEHSNELKDFKRKCMQKDIYDENFVGREGEIKTLKEIFINETSKCRGLSICGLGGMGKTSLANEICRRLWASSSQWIVIKIDLRERKFMFNLLRDTLMKLLDQDELMSVFQDTSEEDMKKQIFDKVTSEHDRMVLLLDNCDDVLEKEEEKFLKFTRDLLQQISGSKHCKVRLIITSRQKLTWGRQQETDKNITAVFQELLRECEVKELKPEDAVLLFRKCTKKDQASEIEVRKIVSLCHYIPLAIRTVCSTLKIEGSISPLDMIKLLDADRSIVLGIDHCLSPAFTRLDKKFQSALLQLCLFRTAEFDINAAKSVLLDFDKDQNVAENDEIATLKTKFQLLHLKSRHLLEIHDRSIQCEDDESGIDTLYSIHPLVYDFLQREDLHQSDPGIQRDIVKAKERFACYCNSLIDGIGDKVETGPVELNVILKNNRMLFMSFFNILSTVAKPDSGDPSKFYLQNRQLSSLSDLLMVDNKARNERLELIKKWKRDAEKERILENAVFWHAEKLLALMEKHEINGLKDIENAFVTTLEGQARHDVQYEVLGRYYYAVARVYSYQAERQQALHSLEKAVKWYERIHERGYYLTMDIADVYNSIGCHSFESSDMTTARKYHEKALDLCSAHVQSNINPNVRVYLCNIGACLFNEGTQLDRQRGKGVEKFQEALNYYTQAITLDKQGNMDEKETHMEKLVNRAMVYVHLGQFEKGLKDVHEAENIRRKILPAKHPKRTLSVAKKGEIMYRWAIHLMRAKEIVESFQRLKEAEKYYCEAMKMIRHGGLDREHSDYQSLKDLHVKVLKKLQDTVKLEQANDFYRRFESGEFDQEIERVIYSRQKKENSNIQNSIQSYFESSSDGGGDSSGDSSGDTDEEIDKVMALTASGQLPPEADSKTSATTSSTLLRPCNLPLQKGNSSDEVFISPSVVPEIRLPDQTFDTQSTNVQPKREELRSDSLTSSSCRSSGSLSSQISITEYQNRPSLMSSQSSSMEDITDDHTKRKSSKKILKRQNATSQFINRTIRKNKAARRDSWLSSSTESLQSIEDIQTSGLDVVNKRKQLKSESSGQSDQGTPSFETIERPSEMQSTVKRAVDDSSDSDDAHKRFKSDSESGTEDDGM